MRSRRHRFLLSILSGVLLVACSSSGTDDPDGSSGSTTDTDPGPSLDALRGADGGVDLCAYLAEDDLDALNPRDHEPVSTILLGDFSYLGCTIGDPFSISFGIRLIDDGASFEDLLNQQPMEPVADVGDEAYVALEQYGGTTVGSETVARFGDLTLVVRNSSLGNSDPDVRVSDDRVYEAMDAFVSALPDDIVEVASTADVDEDVCPAVDSAVVEDLVGTVVLARGGHADDTDRCAYRGEGGGQIRLSSWTGDGDDYTLNGDPITLERPEGASGAIVESTGTADLTILSPGERISYITVIAPGGVDAPDVDANAAVALAEEFVSMVG